MWIGLGVIATLFVAAIVYDASNKDMIRDGVHVAGVNVGGLTAEQAKRKLRRNLAPKLERPVKIQAGGQKYWLTVKQAALTADVDAMVDDAIDESRSNMLAIRVFNDLTGAKSNANLPAEVGYSRLAVRKFVKSVKANVDRPPQDASVGFETADLPVVPSKSGLKVNQAKLRVSVEEELSDSGGRAVKPDVKVTKPKVTSSELAPKYPTVVTVNRSTFKLRLFKNLKLVKTYPVAVGQAGLDTPAGLYHVQDKTVDPTWIVPDKEWAGDLAGKTIPGGAPDNPLKARWLGIFDGAGIHGTADEGSLGSAASHGCIRMAVSDVIALYPEVPVGAPVYIE